MRYIANIGIPEHEMDRIDACFYSNAYGYTFDITFPNGAPFSIGSESYSCGPPEYHINEGDWDGGRLSGLSDYPIGLIGTHVLESWDMTTLYEFRIFRTESEEITTEFSQEES